MVLTQCTPQSRMTLQEWFSSSKSWTSFDDPEDSPCRLTPRRRTQQEGIEDDLSFDSKTPNSMNYDQGISATPSLNSMNLFEYMNSMDCSTCVSVEDKIDHVDLSFEDDMSGITENLSRNKENINTSLIDELSKCAINYSEPELQKDKRHKRLSNADERKEALNATWSMIANIESTLKAL